MKYKMKRKKTRRKRNRLLSSFFLCQKKVEKVGKKKGYVGLQKAAELNLIKSTF